MAENEGFGRRLRDARRDVAKATDEEPSYQEIGELVARRVGRKEPYRYQTVAQWFSGREPESLAVVAALAVVLGINPCFLAFGDEGGGGMSMPAARMRGPGDPIPRPAEQGGRRRSG